MATSQTPGSGFSVSTGPLMTGGALMGIGALFGVAGLVLSGSALIRAVRQWVQEMDMPPSEVARAKWAQAKAATSAGASAWQNGLATQGRR
ncbi:MAG: hypothetical protein ACLPN6_10835 [Streptosporangiaceae bacterium]|jgi:hypothetical protein